jgi:tryptophan-rich sensory protein
MLLTFCAPLFGTMAGPGEWYESLNKPSWNPPGWLFGPVWTVLYLLMAVAAWRVWRRGGWAEQGPALRWYLLQLLLNAAWTPVFFGLKNPGLGLVVILLLWLAIFLTQRQFAKVDRIAAVLLVPYGFWVSFATVLNATLWRLNS